MKSKIPTTIDVLPWAGERLNRFLFTSLLFIVSLPVLFPANVFAQFQPRSQTRRSGAQIKLNRDADRLIRRARKKRRKGDLEGFIRDVQKAKTTYGEWLVTSPHQEGLYVGVEHTSRTLLLSLKKKGRRLYRELFEKRARERLRDAGTDPPAKRLLEVYDRYPLTASAARALRTLSNRYVKQGRFERAQQVLLSLFRLQRDPGARARTAARQMYCLSRLGREEALRQLGSDLPESLLDRPITWYDRSAPLREILSTLIESVSGRREPSTTPGEPAVSWTAPGGGAQQANVHGPDVSLDQLSLKNSFSPSPPAIRRYREVEGTFNRSSISHNRTSGYFPVIADQRLVMNNGLSVWSWPFPPDRNRFDDQPEEPPRNLLRPGKVRGSKVLFDDRLVFPGTYGGGTYFAPIVTGIGDAEKQMLKLQVTYPLPWRSLYAVDPGTGDVRWKRGGKHGKEPFFRGTSFPAGAVYRDGKLFATVTKFNTSKDTPDLFAVALDPERGTLLWKTFLTKNMLSSNLFQNSIREVVPSVVAAGPENVYLSTNVGQVAAVNQESGNISWLYRYEQRSFPRNQSLQPIRQRLLWRNNLPLLMGDTLLVSPPDATHLIAFDRTSGRILWKHHYAHLRKKLNSFPRWLVPLGSDGYLLAGSTSLGVYSLEKGTMVSRAYNPADEIKGRPAATRRHIYLPTEDGIEKIRYRRQNGREFDDLKRVALFSPEENYVPGSLFLTGRTLMCFSSKRFLVYVEQQQE